MFSELGPFFPSPDDSGQTLVNNPYSWANVANVIFLESPAGVGFSYSDEPEDYVVGDARTSRDVFVALQQFVLRYPSFAGRPLYLSGESYGGHYVPNAAAYIVAQTLAGNNSVSTGLNISGFAVGNAWTVAELDNTGAVQFWYDHGMISNDTLQGVLSTCNMSDIGPLFAQSAAVEGARGRLGFTSSSGDACDDFQNTAFAQMGNVNIYDVYVDVCNAASSAKSRATRVLPTGGLTEGSNNAAGCSNSYEPCIDDSTSTYLNRAEVKAAIHALPNITWTDCSSIITYSRFDLLTSMLPVYEYLLTSWPQGKWLVYSGDVDAIVPFAGTRLWLSRLGLPVSKADGTWRSWNVGGQVGGWWTAYDGPNNSRLGFATVRNAGHFVPGTQQERALYMLTQYLRGNAL